MTAPEQRAFARFLDAVAPFLDRIVIAGGWTSRLFHHSDQANEVEYAPLRTKDVDAVVPPRLSAGPDGLKNLQGRSLHS